MYLILLCFGTLFGLGAFFLLAGLLRLPTSASTKAVLTVTNRGKAKKNILKAYQHNAGHAMKRELEITIADMASGNEVTVTLTTTVNLGLFGEFVSFPVTLTARATGTSEVYWK